MAEHKDDIARIVATLKEPVRIDPTLDKRVMAEIERLSAHPEKALGLKSLFEWLWRPRTVRLTPIAGLAIAAGLVALVLVGSRLVPPPGESGPLATAPAESTQRIQFVFVAPEAASVTVVGDFNDWSVSATPLVQQDSNGLWWVTVPLPPGRYRYSFIVDGTTWLGDPNAPAAEDEFGRPNSVVTIGGA